MPDLPGWDSLATVSKVHNWTELAGIVLFALLVVSEALTYMYGHRKDDLVTQQQDATQKRHDEEIARLHLETDQAKERTEQLRAENLALEKAMSPRLLTQAPGFERLKPFAETKATILYVQDFEPRRMAGQIALLLEMAGWPRPEMHAISDAMDGIEIEAARGASPVEETTSQKAADTLRDVFLASEIDARSHRTRDRLPPDHIRITVGAKPMTYFLEQRMPPWAKEMMERLERNRKDAEERLKAGRDGP